MIGRMADAAAGLSPLQRRLRETALALISDRRARDLHPAIAALEARGDVFILSEEDNGGTLLQRLIEPLDRDAGATSRSIPLTLAQGADAIVETLLSLAGSSLDDTPAHLCFEALVARPSLLVSASDCHYGVVTASALALAHAAAALKAEGAAVGWAGMAIVCPHGRWVIRIGGDTARLTMADTATGRLAA